MKIATAGLRAWALMLSLGSSVCLAQAALDQPDSATEVDPPATTADAIGAGAEAPPAADAAQAKGPKSALVEEIVVTAQKREEKLANVPISIQAFSPEALNARNITSQLGLSRAVPSLDVGSQAGYATIFLRGIGTEAFLTADPVSPAMWTGFTFRSRRPSSRTLPASNGWKC